MAAACGIKGRDKAYTIAQSHGRQPITIAESRFDLVAFIKNDSDEGGDHQKTWIIYIEGDGRAWNGRYRISDDPTPADPTGLKLAVQDSRPKVAYIGRPCQYLADTGNCDPRYWTSHRYSWEVIAAMNRAVDRIKGPEEAEESEGPEEENDAKARVGLIGFSGGGALAALMAAQRDDVAWLITIGANLDTEAWTSLHRVTPLTGSLNPADFAHTLQSIPQIHLVGERDRIVPVSVLLSYRDRMADASKTVIQVLPEYDHHCCWERTWQRHLQELSKIREELP